VTDLSPTPDIVKELDIKMTLDEVHGRISGALERRATLWTRLWFGLNRLLTVGTGFLIGTSMVVFVGGGLSGGLNYGLGPLIICLSLGVGGLILWGLVDELRKSGKRWTEFKEQKGVLEQTLTPFAILPDRLQLGADTWRWSDVLEVTVTTAIPRQLSILTGDGNAVPVDAGRTLSTALTWLKAVMDARRLAYGTEADVPEGLRALRDAREPAPERS
jgi:hypothetical protein